MTTPIRVRALHYHGDSRVLMMRRPDQPGHRQSLPTGEPMTSSWYCPECAAIVDIQMYQVPDGTPPPE